MIRLHGAGCKLSDYSPLKIMIFIMILGFPRILENIILIPKINPSYSSFRALWLLPSLKYIWVWRVMMKNIGIWRVMMFQNVMA